MARINRSDFLFWTVFYIIASIVINFGLGGKFDSEGLTLIILQIVAVALYIFLAAFERFQDIGKSGWWSLLLFIPLVNLIAIIYLLFSPGTVGKNKYGRDPRISGLSEDDPRLDIIRTEELQQKKQTLEESLKIGVITQSEYDTKLAELECDLKDKKAKIQLKKLFTQGIITKEEYDKKVSELNV